jgi:SAM-dependent methyltransferase
LASTRLQLHPTTCPICGTADNATELYRSTVSEEAFNPAVFSARRLPDRVHYRVVRCHGCGLVRSDPVADPELQAELYAKSTFDYSDEVQNLNATYGRYLRQLERYGVHKGSLLEIGCGNGFFLEEAVAQGYSDVRGVEPSTAAVAGAPASVRGRILCDIMRPGLYPPDSFDVICMFQTFDHIPDPRALLHECLRVLKTGGLMLCFNHNVGAVSARIMGERSPIIDVEHPFLYTPDTMRRIFQAAGFEVVKVGSARNRYRLQYLARLVPLPRAAKQAALKLLAASRGGRLRLSVPLGNLYFVARKRAASS